MVLPTFVNSNDSAHGDKHHGLCQLIVIVTLVMYYNLKISATGEAGPEVGCIWSDLITSVIPRKVSERSSDDQNPAFWKWAYLYLYIPNLGIKNPNECTKLFMPE